MKIKILYPLVLFLIGTFSSLLAQQFETDLKGLSTGADLIVTGKVINQQSVWNTDKTRIYTNVTIHVDECLKGENNGKTIVVTHPGGEIDNVGELYTHIPTFQNNEEILLFLKENIQNENYEVFLGESGKITIFEDKVTGEKRTVNNRKLVSLENEIRKSIKH